jgi:hypothetical protein
MKQYPYFSPLILTDDVFTSYGGQTGTSTANQRQASYLLAEIQMTSHLSSFLVPTIITGNAVFEHGRQFSLEFGHVQRILAVQIETVTNNNPLTTRIYTGSAMVVSADYGYINIFPPVLYGCIDGVDVVYESGLSSGTVTQPNILQALTMAAQINLNEMDVSLSNESTADIGVQQFSNQSYSESRTKLGKNNFGDSAMAQRISRLTKMYRSKPGLKFR